MSPRIVVEEPWSYVLFEQDGDVVLTFLVSGSREREFSVRLTPAEIALQRQDRGFAERLLRRLANHPEQLRRRQLPQALWPEATARR